MGETVKSTKPKTRKAPKDPFAVFKRTTAEAFSFLVDDYHFEHVATLTNPPECAIEYRNDTTAVIVEYEWGGAAWVYLNRLQRKGDEVSRGEGYSLDVLMLERLPGRNIDEFRRSKDESPDQYVQRVLPEYAHIIKECGTDILKGDFQTFPKLKKHAAEVLRQRNRELFA